MRGVTGDRLLAILENGVSAYPRMEGRFPCVAGVRFTFDPARPVGARILTESVTIRGVPLMRERVYRVATKEYLATGRDGYTAFVGTPVLVDAENCPTLPVLVRAHLTLLTAASAFMMPNPALSHAVAKLLRPIARRANDAARRHLTTPAGGGNGSDKTASPSPSASPVLLPAPSALSSLVAMHATNGAAASASASGPLAGTIVMPHPDLARAAAAAVGRGIHPDDAASTAPQASVHATPASANSSSEDLASAHPSSICLLSSDDDDDEAYPDAAAAHRRDTVGAMTRRSVHLDRTSRHDMLRVTAVVDGRIQRVGTSESVAA